jgi:hypothetical protein
VRRLQQPLTRPIVEGGEVRGVGAGAHDRAPEAR